MCPHFNVGCALTFHLQDVIIPRVIEPKANIEPGIQQRGTQCAVDAEYIPPTVGDVVLHALYTLTVCLAILDADATLHAKMYVECVPPTAIYD